MSDYGLWRAVGGSVEWKSSGPARALKVLDYPHHKVHAGEHYVVTTSATKNAAQKLDLLLTTPATKQMHYVAEYAGSGQITAALYENPTVLLTSFVGLSENNNNRNSANVASMTAGTISSTDVTAAGTQLLIQVMGGGLLGRTGGDVVTRAEFILKQNEQYLVELESGAAGNLITYAAYWYEEST